MNEAEAFAMVGRLSAIAGTSWPDPTVEAWVELFLDIEDVDAAHDATEVIRKSWRKTERPPFAVWNEQYGIALVRRREERERQSRGTGGEVVSLTMSLDRALARGDLNEIRKWARHAAKWRRDTTDSFGQTEEWSGELIEWFKKDGRQHYLEETL